jgi:hypothetical protein
MREIKQLHAASKKTPLFVFHLSPHRLPLRPVLHLGGHLQSRQPSITCCIQESDGLHQIFSGNQTRMGVTYLQFQLATWRLQPRRSEWFTILQSKLARTLRLTGLHGSCSA